MKRIILFIFIFSLLPGDRVLAKKFRKMICPDAYVRSKYHHYEMGGIAFGNDWTSAITSRGWLVRVRDDGELIWRLESDCKPVSDLIIYDTNMYYACAEGILVSRDIETGEEKWRFKYSDSVASKPAIKDGLIVFQTGSGMVFCLNETDGSLKWIFRQPGMRGVSMMSASQPLIIDDRVYAGMREGLMVALRLDDGTAVWKKQVFKGAIISDIDYMPQADENTIYAGSFEGLAGISKTSGKIYWVLNENLAGDFTLDQDKIYAITGNKELLVIDKITGLIDKKINLKKSSLQKYEPEKLLAISLIEDKLLIVYNNGLWEVEKNSDVPQKIRSFSSPVQKAEIREGKMCLISPKGYLVCEIR